MPKISIGYIQKNGSTYIGNKIVNSDHVPRVGELIRDTEMITRVDQAMVLSVVHEVVDDSLTVHIVAQEWHQGYRDNELANFGWLPTTESDHRTHDEDLMRFSDFETETSS